MNESNVKYTTIAILLAQQAISKEYFERKNC
jgi:hypothetical protein